MLDNRPWQGALGNAFVGVVALIILMIIALVFAFFNWVPLLTAAFMLMGFVFIILLIPTFLNLSRGFFNITFFLLLSHIAVTIVAFALHYKAFGLIRSNVRFVPSFLDAVYFSITTFTTLGYGDFQPVLEIRLLTSIEALTGMISMGVGISLLWLWCNENIIPKEMAFFDGNHRHKTALGTTRMRTKTITGKEKKLKDWRLPAQEGESYRWDEKREEWLKVDDKDSAQNS